MTQLRNLLQRIAAAAGPALGFGAGSSDRLPGMALIARCSGDLDAALTASGDAADACVIFGPGLTPDALPDLAGRIWGIGGVPLQPGVVREWQAAGADFAVAPLFGSYVDAIDIAQPTLTAGVRIPDDADDAVWRILDGIPVDLLVLDKSALSGQWTLTDLGQVAAAARRTDKQLLVRIGARPTANELLAIKQAGAAAIVAEANALGADGMAELKSDLLALPRLQPPPRRAAAALESP